MGSDLPITAKPAEASLDLSDFLFERIAFNADYQTAFLHWDRAGSIWSGVRRKWPDIKILDVNPSKTVCSLQGRFELAIQLERTIVVDYNPNYDMNHFTEIIDSFLGILVKMLEISDYTRLGLRLVYFMECQDIETASLKVLNTNLVNLPKPKSEKIYGIGGKPLYPEYSVRWEGKSIAATVRLKAETRKIEFSPPLVIKDLSPISKEKYGITFDVDYFTLAPVSVAQFSPKEWVGQVSHFVRRDSTEFLGGV